MISLCLTTPVGIDSYRSLTSLLFADRKPSRCSDPLERHPYILAPAVMMRVRLTLARDDLSHNVRPLSPGSLARAKAHGVNANLKLELLDDYLHTHGYDAVFFAGARLVVMPRDNCHTSSDTSPALLKKRLGTAVLIHNRLHEVGKIRFAPISEKAHICLVQRGQRFGPC